MVTYLNLGSVSKCMLKTDKMDRISRSFFRIKRLSKPQSTKQYYGTAVNDYFSRIVYEYPVGSSLQPSSQQALINGGDQI
jgi:hypothetical protein